MDHDSEQEIYWCRGFLNPFHPTGRHTHQLYFRVVFNLLVALGISSARVTSVSNEVDSVVTVLSQLVGVVACTGAEPHVGRNHHCSYLHFISGEEAPKESNTEVNNSRK